MRIIRAVIVADARMVAADDEVRAAEVFPHHGMENRFARTGIAHRSLEDAQENAVFRIIVFQQHLIAFHPDVGRNIVRFRFADERV